MSHIEVVADVNNRLGESVVWHAASQRLYWIDLLDPALFTHDPATRQTTRRSLPFSPPLGAIVATTDPGRLLLGCRLGIVSLDIATLEWTLLVDPENGRAGVALNDGKVDRHGRLWTGSSDLSEIEPRGCLWCIGKSGKATLADAGFAVSNGPAFSADGRRMYVSDSAARRVLVYDLEGAGPHLKERRVFLTLAPEEGMPDGLAVDAEDCLWVAHWAAAAITRWSSEGKRLVSIAVPAVHVTAVAFGGTGFRSLYFSTAREGATQTELERLPLSGHLFVCKPGVAGLAEPLFEL